MRLLARCLQDGHNRGGYVASMRANDMAEGLFVSVELNDAEGSSDNWVLASNTAGFLICGMLSSILKFCRGLLAVAVFGMEFSGGYELMYRSEGVESL